MKPKSVAVGSRSSFVIMITNKLYDKLIVEYGSN